MEKIGIIAGGGLLPYALCETLIAQELLFVVAALQDFSPSFPLPSSCSVKKFNIAQVGKIIDYFRAHHIHNLIMVGHVKRPSFTSLKPDLTGLQLLSKIMAHKMQGDDALLRVVMEFLEAKGFTMQGIKEVAPQLLASKGVCTAKHPSSHDMQDIMLGKKVLNALGECDVGQAVVVAKGRILAIEGAEGTDQLIIRSAVLKEETARQGVLVKMCKRAQEKRLDLPAIGVDTVEQVYRAGLSGIAVEAGATILINQEKIVQTMNQHGLFLYGLDAHD